MQTVNTCRCGAEVQPNAIFCWLCGEKILPPESSSDNNLPPIVAIAMQLPETRKVPNGFVVVDRSVDPILRAKGPAVYPAQFEGLGSVATQRKGRRSGSLLGSRMIFVDRSAGPISSKSGRWSFWPHD